MTRLRAGSGLGMLASAGYVGTAWLHGTGYDSVSRLAAEGPEDLLPLMQALWVGFSFSMIVAGLLSAAVAIRRPAGAGMILTFVALSPFSAAGLQVWYLGFIPPTAILLALGVITIVAGGLLAKRT